MKKNRANPPKPKEFVSTPFSALKGVKPLPAEPAPATVQKPPPVKQSEPDDMDLFLLAMNGVERIDPAPRRKSAEHPVTPQKAVVRKIEESEQKLFLETISNLKLDVRFHDELPEDTPQEKLRSISRIKQLRRGTIRLDYELDLHGLTRDEAIHALETFVKGAYRRGQQAVLVITGRGNHSPDEPVLKRSAETWLKESGASMVAEFFSAPRQFGGDGAVVVFLKKSTELKKTSESA
jgi:DNA-nicking Smr family endonuclease